MRVHRIPGGVFVGAAYECPDALTDWHHVLILGFLFWEAEVRVKKILPDRKKRC